MKTIAWVNHKLGKSQKVLDVLKQAGFTGLLINVAEYSQEPYVYKSEYDLMTIANLHNFPDSLLSLGTGEWRERQKLYPEIKKYYLGECKTTYYQGKLIWDSNEIELQFNTNGSRNYVCDEPSILKLEEYRNHLCEVTYSSYRKYWVWLERLSYWLGSKTGWRIPRYGNQIFAWQWLRRNFENWHPDSYPIKTIRFNYCWINLQLNKNHFPELIKWCKDHQKTIMLYVEWDVTEEQFLRELPEFTKIYKDVYEIS